VAPFVNSSKKFFAYLISLCVSTSLRRTVMDFGPISQSVQEVCQDEEKLTCNFFFVRKAPCVSSQSILIFSVFIRDRDDFSNADDNQQASAHS
jgi:hypothetical protein